MNKKKIKVAILISGRGSNMRALINSCKNADFPSEIVLALSNKKDAVGLEFARSEGIKTSFVDHKNFPQSREEFDRQIHEEIKKSGAEIICLAGFMRLLSPWFVNQWHDQIINIHPSLLPEFKGADAVGDAIKAGAKKSGCTVHFVREEMDSGPIILQSEVDILAEDTRETLAVKILEQEHQIYPEALKKICLLRLADEEDDQRFVDKQEEQEEVNEVESNVPQEVKKEVRGIINTLKSFIFPKNNQQRNLSIETGGLEAEEKKEISSKDIWDDRSEEVDKMSVDTFNTSGMRSVVWNEKRKRLKAKKALKNSGEVSSMMSSEMQKNPNSQGYVSRLKNLKQDHSHEGGGGILS